MLHFNVLKPHFIVAGTTQAPSPPIEISTETVLIIVVSVLGAVIVFILFAGLVTKKMDMWTW